MKRRRTNPNHLLNASANRFFQIFDKASRELVEKVLSAFALRGREENTLTGEASWFTKRERATHLLNLEKTIRKYMPELYDAIDEETLQNLEYAVNYVREYSRKNPLKNLDDLLDSELHAGTLKLQRRILENELTTAFITSRTFAGRMINSWGLDLAKRAAVQEAVAEGIVRGGGSKIIADKVFNALNKTGNFTSQELALIKGKFIHINGRNYDLAKYSELVAHVRLAELNNRTVINESIEEGYLCIQIDYHNTTADICRPFEATIWSITGEAVGQYPPLSHCLNGGPPFHPRCSHYVRPIDVEYSGGKRAKVTDAEFDERKYEPNDAVKKASTRVHQKIMNAPVFPSVVKYKTISAPMRKRAMNYFPGITEKDIAKVKAKAGAVFQSTKNVDSKRQKLSVEAWKAKRAAEEKPKKESRTQRQLNFLEKQPILKADNLFDDDIGFDDGVKIAEKYYDKLRKKPIKSKALGSKEVIFDDLAWKYIKDKNNPKDSFDRLKRLKKYVKLINKAKFIFEERRLKSGDINYTFIGRFKDDVVRAVVQEKNGTFIFYNGFPDSKLIKKSHK